MATIAEKLRRSVVGIAGLGGLGSNVTVALARAGLGTFIIADLDSVEPSNLNRQHYFLDQLGKHKVDCMLENLRRINPELRVEDHKVKLTPANIPEIFSSADVIAECFDTAEAKQMIVETVLSKMKAPIVSVSGLAGYGNSNEIITRRISERLILIGDGHSASGGSDTLTAPRVALAAAHQANAILEIIIDRTKT